MKTPPHVRSRSSGFTLIELLVVISIIAALAALTLAGVAVSQKRGKISDTTARIKVIDDCLTRYKGDNGEYPEPVNESIMGTFFGSEWRAGGAACLYQVLSGDGNDQIKGYKVRGAEKLGSSIGEFGSSEGKIYLEDANVQRSQWFINASGNWVLVDAFKLPFQYRPKTAAVPADTMHNETTYDLWSYGTLKAPSDDTDLQSAKEWITNWK
jgi:prepilin-type N-terminal cleavage/methylation domain-containing protein